MTTVTPYDHTRDLFGGQEVDLTDLAVMLVNGHSFDAAETAMTNIEADEVHGSGWTEGGEALASAAVTTVNTNEAMLDAANISVTATGGDIGPATGAVIYQVTEEYPLFYIDFEVARTASEGAAFQVNWSASGIHRWVNPS